MPPTKTNSPQFGVILHLSEESGYTDKVKIFNDYQEALSKALLFSQNNSYYIESTELFSLESGNKQTLKTFKSGKETLMSRFRRRFS
jgi:hypothetical protein